MTVLRYLPASCMWAGVWVDALHAGTVVSRHKGCVQAVAENDLRCDPGMVWDSGIFWVISTPVLWVFAVVIVAAVSAEYERGKNLGALLWGTVGLFFVSWVLEWVDPGLLP